MPAVWETRFAQLVRTLTALRESAALELLPDLMPVLPVVDARAPEMALIRRERLSAGYANQAAVAAQYSLVALSNPAGSGMLIAVDGFSLWAGATTGIKWEAQFGASALPSAFYGHSDLRGLQSVNQVPIGEVRSGSNAGLPTLRAGRQITQAAQLSAWVPYQAVLPPDSQLLFACETANTSVSISLIWRERRADPAELASFGA